MNNNIISQLQPLQTNSSGIASEVSKAKTDFSEVFAATIKQVNDAQNDGDNAIKDLQSGKAEHLHEVMLSVEKADISLKMLVQLRNKALSAYDEIMRMQV
ncbi:MAG: flagellar hook-basal body complex protein FliE [Desulfotalea sp.]